MRRVQAFVAAVLAAVAVGGAAYADRELGPKALGAGGAGAVPSGGWYCPHGGGAVDWEVALHVANPGPSPATIRVRTIGAERSTEAQVVTVEPGASATVPVSGDERGSASLVEWFDQWVAVGWVSHAGGDEGGVAAEPCAPAAGRRWFLPDGTSEEERHDDFLVIMNPFARTAVFSITLLSERIDPVQQGDLTDVLLRPFRSRAIRLDRVVDGERTVSAFVEASVGRIAAATLGVNEDGGIRSALGYLGALAEQLVFPGGADAGRADLVVMTTGDDRVAIAGDLLGEEEEQPFAGLADSAPPVESGRTFPTTTAGPTSVVFTSGPGVAATRRTFGVVADQASTNGAAPASAWLVPPAVAGSPSNPGLVLVNPGIEPVDVTLSHLAPVSGDPVTLTVAPRSTMAAPAGFVRQAPEGVVLARASDGTFVAASASYSRGREGFATYAVALGIAIPESWLVPG